MIEIIPYIILAIEDDGDREFMAWLYIQYQSLLYSEIIRIVQSSTDAEDVLHTVIEKLIDKVFRYDVSRLKIFWNIKKIC